MSLGGCDNITKHDKPTIAVSIEPLRYFVERIAGDDFDVVSIIPEGASAEKLRAHSAEHARCHHLRPFLLHRVVRQRTKHDRGCRSRHHGTCHRAIQIVPADGPDGRYLTEGVDYSDSLRGVDPHVWISPANGFRMSEKIAEELCRLNPDKATQYRKTRLCSRTI